MGICGGRSKADPQPTVALYNMNVERSPVTVIAHYGTGPVQDRTARATAVYFPKHPSPVEMSNPANMVQNLHRPQQQQVSQVQRGERTTKLTVGTSAARQTNPATSATLKQVRNMGRSHPL